MVTQEISDRQRTLRKASDHVREHGYAPPGFTPKETAGIFLRGAIDFGSSQIGAVALDLSGVIIHGDLEIENMILQGDVRMWHVSIEGYMRCRNVVILGDVDMGEAELRLQLLLENTVIGGGLRLERATIGYGIELITTAVGGTIDFSGLKGAESIKVSSDLAVRVHRAAPHIPIVEVK